MYQDPSAKAIRRASISAWRYLVSVSYEINSAHEW